MQLRIKKDRIGTGIGKGEGKKGQEYIVIGGDLCHGEIIEVDPYKDNDKIFINTKVNYESIEIFSEYFDKDGLIDFHHLKEVKHKSVPNKRIYEIEGFWVFVERRIKEHVEYLYENNLLEKAKIRITKNWNSSAGRVPVYSLNYIELLTNVIKQRKAISSWFICEREKDFDKGVYADLFIIGNLIEGDLQIQLWQIVGEGDEVLFAHGLIDENSFKFKHFDLASHYVEPIMIPRFIYDKKRMDLIKKKKWIRVDGEISKTCVFNMVKMFFPIDYLVEEFLENPVTSHT